MKWTDEQERAIDLRDKNILVAAAAGSGKTAVLVQRIRKLIIEEGVPIDRMLIVTFTSAAASEMREKIRETIKKALEEESTKEALLHNQLDLLPRANISTFHAFAQDVIKTFYYMIDAETGYGICDDAQQVILQEEALDQVLEDEFAKESPDFYAFLDAYSNNRDLEKIRVILTENYKVLRNMPYPWQWLDENIEKLNIEEKDFLPSDFRKNFEGILKEKITVAMTQHSRAINILLDEGLDRMAELLKPENDVFSEVLDMVTRGEIERLTTETIDFPKVSLRAKAEEKEQYALIMPVVKKCREKAKEELKKLKTDYLGMSFSQMVKDINATAPYAKTLKELLMSFDRAYSERKKQKNLVDFGDIEHYCLDILSHEEAAAYYRDKFQYIFIDEYQDTNVLQEVIISKVKREDNLFMVGDIKQSIYKFRLAEPENFKRKYENYKREEDENSTVIDLNTNFRSKEPIIDGINRIFEPIMEGYDEDAKLKAGLPDAGAYSFTPCLKLINGDAAEEADYPELKVMTSTEAEALMVCKIIKDNLGRDFYDTKEDRVRPLEYRDIVILMRSVRSAGDIYNQIMKEEGIPCFFGNGKEYLNTIEINVFMDLLSVIDNRHQDIPLLGVLRSEIFGFSTEELGRIRSEHKEGTYLESLVFYSKDGKKTNLAMKAEKALSDLDRWKRLSLVMPLGAFIWKLMLETGYYLIIGATPRGAQRQGNLRALIDYAEAFSEKGQTSLFGFVHYMNTVKEKAVDFPEVSLVGENEDLVRMMTIHKSKGLEFPMVIIPGLGKGLQYTRGGQAVDMHKEIGIGLKLVNRKERWSKDTLIQKLIQNQKRKEEVEENKRVLYVAMTRAKDFLYLIGTVKDGEKYREEKNAEIYSDTSFLNIIPGFAHTEIVQKEELIDKAVSLDVVTMAEEDSYKGFSGSDKDQVDKRLNFVYPYESSATVRSKYSVSQLNEAAKSHDYEPKLSVPAFRLGEKKLTAAQKGTVYHGIMEHVDLRRLCIEGRAYLDAAVQDLCKRELFSKEEIASIDLEKIVHFVNTDIGKRAVAAFNSGQLHREKGFNLITEKDGEKIIVQGIIDCFFREDDKLILLDYKTNWIDMDKPIEEEKQRLENLYREQIRIYAEALKKAYGMDVSESYLYLFSAQTYVEVNIYE